MKREAKSISLTSSPPSTESNDTIYEDLTEDQFEDDLSTAKDISTNVEPLSFEYHILYHMSYAVPYLSFNAYKSGRYMSHSYSYDFDGSCLYIFIAYSLLPVQGGSSITLEEAWNIFNNGNTYTNNHLMTSILTQMEHPVLFKPFLTLHPCRTAEILKATPKSRNKVLTFVSSVGPAIQLTMDIKYADYCRDDR